MGRVHRWFIVITVAMALGCVSAPRAAWATYPGRNGPIAFYANRGDHPRTRIYAVTRSGASVHALTAGSNASHEEWSPDGRRVVFEVDPGEGHQNVWIMNADGTGARDLTGDRRACESEPSFTPDGRHIVFIHVAGTCGHDRNKEIWIMDLRGGERRRIAAIPRSNGSDPNVSPDGSTISFLVQRPGEQELGGALYVVGMDGEDMHRIVPFRYDVGIKHDWSPDGRWIVFTEYLDYNEEVGLEGHSPNVAIVRPDGSDVTVLTHVGDAGREAIAGSFSPDGRWIVYRVDNYEHFRLMRVSIDGSNTPLLIERLRLKPRGMDWGSRPKR